MSKTIIAFSIVGFWILLPIGLMLAGIGGFDELDTKDIHQAEEPTTLSLILDLGNYILVYFKLMFFSIPNVNPIITRFVNFLQIMSALIVLLIIRGN